MDLLPHETRFDSKVDYRSEKEEFLNFTTHAVGFILALVGFYFLVPAMQSQGLFVRFVTWVYGTNLVALYAASALSHYYHRTKLRSLYRKLDQALIYTFIIAGFTPYFAVHMTETWAWIGVALLWLMAIAGFCSKLFIGHRVEGITTWSYLALAWLPVLGMPFAKSLPWMAMGFITAGGMIYMLGIVFLLQDRKQWYLHSIWHLFVIGGTTVHYLGIQYSLAS